MEWKTEDITEQFDNADIAGNKTAAAFSYLGLLVLVPVLAAKDSKFARFHANQGLVLMIAWAAYSFAVSIFSAVLLAVSWRLYAVVQLARLLGIVFPIADIMGICNAVSGKAKEFPIIGKIHLIQ